MQRLLFLLLCCCASQIAAAQLSDILSVRRPNGRTIKSFYAGSYISFVTKYGTPVSGTINTLRNDSLLINTFNTRVVPTYLGVTIVDTFAFRIEKIHYKDIGQIQIFTKHRDIYRRLGSYMIIGGGGFIFLNTFNGLLEKADLFEKGNLRRLGTAAGIAVSGIALQVATREVRNTKKRHNIVYISLQP